MECGVSCGATTGISSAAGEPTPVASCDIVKSEHGGCECGRCDSDAGSGGGDLIGAVVPSEGRGRSSGALTEECGRLAEGDGEGGRGDSGIGCRGGGGERERRKRGESEGEGEVRIV